MNPTKRRVLPILAGFALAAVAASAPAQVTGVGSDVLVAPGGTATVAFTLTAADGMRIDGVNGELTFDPAVLSNPQVAVAAGQPAGYVAVGRENATGTFRFVLYHPPSGDPLVQTIPALNFLFDAAQGSGDPAIETEVEFSVLNNAPDVQNPVLRYPAAARVASASPVEVVSLGVGGQAIQFQGFTVTVGNTPVPTPSPSPTPDVTPSPSPTPEATATPEPSPSPTPGFSILGNISTRGAVGTGDSIMIAGLIVTGDGPRRILVTGVGPDLANSGVTGVLADPTLALLQGNTVLQTNDNWMESADVVEIMGSGFAPNNGLESAIVADLSPGEYTAFLSGVESGTGVGLVQAFDIGPGGGRLRNISTRLFVGTGEQSMIGGFIVQGGNPKQVVIRALGPTLGQPPFNVTGALADPEIAIFQGSTLLTANGNWRDDPTAAVVEGFSLNPPSDLESAMFRELAPGSYTAIVTGAGGATGTALIEVYEVDSPDAGVQ